MMKMNRTPEPNYLKIIKKSLVEEFLAGKDFDYTYRGYASVLRNDLNALTNNHCAYCDCILLPSQKPQIDHFKPKAKYKLLAYSWINLFPSCENCNKKKSQRVIKIRPDSANYQFSKYFWIKNDGILRAKNTEAQQIIDLFDLNNTDIIEYRINIICGNIESKQPKYQPYRYIKW